MPDTALKGFNSSLKNQLTQKAYRGEFNPVPNRKNVWKKIIELNGRDFVIHAIETKG